MALSSACVKTWGEPFKKYWCSTQEPRHSRLTKIQITFYLFIWYLRKGEGRTEREWEQGHGTHVAEVTGHTWQRPVCRSWAVSSHPEGLRASGWEQAPLSPAISAGQGTWFVRDQCGNPCLRLSSSPRYFSLHNIYELPESELGPEYGATTAHRTERNQDVFMGMLASANSSWPRGSHFKGVWNGCIWPRWRFGMTSCHTLNRFAFPFEVGCPCVHTLLWVFSSVFAYVFILTLPPVEVLWKVQRRKLSNFKWGNVI